MPSTLAGIDGMWTRVWDWRWRRIWFFFLLTVFLVWLAFELASIFYDHGMVSWTLSDTIRDWQSHHPWLRWAVAAAFIGLWVHFFVQKNAPPRIPLRNPPRSIDGD